MPRKVLDLLAPRGALRPAINLANTVLTQRRPTGELDGAALRLASAMAERLGVAMQPAFYDSAGQVTQAADADEWDVGFLAIDPARTALIRFTSPYLFIESTYLVGQDGPRTLAAIDRPGMRVAVAKGAAYDLFLSRELRHARLVHASTPKEAFAIFMAGGAEALAGVRQALRQFAKEWPARVLQDSFQQVQHAMALPVRAAAALPWLESFLAEAKGSGFVREAMSETGQTDASLAP